VVIVVEDIEATVRVGVVVGDLSCLVLMTRLFLSGVSYCYSSPQFFALHHSFLLLFITCYGRDVEMRREQVFLGSTFLSGWG
jgi:hypothetical protein